MTHGPRNARRLIRLRIHSYYLILTIDGLRPSSK